jgi:hypothetical protein
MVRTYCKGAYNAELAYRLPLLALNFTLDILELFMDRKRVTWPGHQGAGC